MFMLFRYGLIPVVLFCGVVIAASIDTYSTNIVQKSTWRQTVVTVMESQDFGQGLAEFRGTQNTFPDPHGTVQYVIDGKTYTWQGRGRDMGVTVMNPGDEINVYYNPGNPLEINTLVLLGASTGNIILAVALAFLAFYVWFFWLRGFLGHSTSRPPCITMPATGPGSRRGRARSSHCRPSAVLLGGGVGGQGIAAAVLAGIGAAVTGSEDHRTGRAAVGEAVGKAEKGRRCGHFLMVQYGGDVKMSSALQSRNSDALPGADASARSGVSWSGLRSPIGGDPVKLPGFSLLLPIATSSRTGALSWREAIEQEVEAFPESTVPIVIQQQTRAFDCRVAFAETCKALLRGGPVVVREVEARPRDGGAHHIVPERPYRDVQICVRYTSSGQGLAQQFQATEVFGPSARRGNSDADQGWRSMLARQSSSI